MKSRFKILIILIFSSITFYGQEKDSECVEYEPIELYNLRKLIIDKQKLDVWPSIVQIKELNELNESNEKINDSLILFIVETDNGDKLRMTNTSDLSKFAEMDYNDDCKQEGTILTDFKIGMIDKQNGEIEILCKQDYYGKLKIKN